jgi:RNA polymerase sigma-70 factor (ECF subfamily)
VARTAEAATTSLDPFEQFRAGRLDAEVARVRVEELFLAHRRKVERMCRALLRDRQESEDAAQQTFLSAFRALRNGAVPRDGEAWLGSIARNECLGRIRDRMHEPLSTLMFEIEDGNADVHRQATSNMNAAHLWQEIQSLPDQQRDAIVLREFAGLSYGELVVALGVSDAAVESLLFRARGTLRRRLTTALASVNVAGAASGAASALARIFAGGVAPIATKAAAVGAGTVVLGAGWFAGGGALTLPKASQPRAPLERRAVAPPLVTIAAASPGIALTSNGPASPDGERSGRHPAVSEGDSSGGGDGTDESLRATRITIAPSTMPLESLTSSSGDGGEGGRDGGRTTVQRNGSDGESGSSLDGGVRTTSDGGD